MDNFKIRPININLKQISVIETDKQTPSKDKSNQIKDHQSKDKQTSVHQTKSKNDQSSNQLNQMSNEKQKNNDKKSTETIKKSTDNRSTDNRSTDNKSITNSSKKKMDNQSDSNRSIKKLKVPFDLKPSNPIKNEPKYSKENQNLRLLNQVDEKRKDLSNIKIKNLNDKKDKSTGQTNLKIIQTSAQNSIDSTAKNNQIVKNNQPLIANQTPNKQISTNSDKTKLNVSNKQPDPKGSNRLINLFLKKVPDQFNYLNDDLDEIELIRSQNGREIEDQTNKSINEKSTDEPSDQLPKSQKPSFEIDELINFKITNENDLNKTKNVIDNLMKVLIEYKKSTYASNLVNDLNTSLKAITKSS